MRLLFKKNKKTGLLMKYTIYYMLIRCFIRIFATLHKHSYSNSFLFDSLLLQYCLNNDCICEIFRLLNDRNKCNGDIWLFMGWLIVRYASYERLSSSSIIFSFRYSQQNNNNNNKEFVLMGLVRVGPKHSEQFSFKQF